MQKSLLACFLFLIFFTINAQEKFSLNGYVVSSEDGESLIGATIFVQELNVGASSNLYGYYSLTLPEGEYTIVTSYISFKSYSKKIFLHKDLRLDIELTSESTTLDEVVVTDLAIDDNITNIEMSTEKLDIKLIEKIPALLGEVDIIKSIQFLPGVSSVGEGSAGFNVRGGSVGQNLILLDDAPVYNSSHLFGFFSVFNPDVVKDVNLLKGAIPANYGGRLSSILDVRMKEGNNKKTILSGGIGTVFSRLSIQGPIKKNKISYLVGGRRSYIDILAKPFTNNATLYFYDLTTKINANIDANNRLYLSGYFGRDVFKFTPTSGFSWGNATGTLRWNHLFNNRLFSNFALITSSFDYGFSFGDDDNDKFIWDSRITTYTFKPYFNYFLNLNNELSFGGEFINYIFKPAKTQGISDNEVSDISLDNKSTFESAIYIDNTQKLNTKLSLRYGLRFSNFSYFGKSTKYTFEENPFGERKQLLSQEVYDDGELISSYNNFEPRFSIRYLLNKGSVKASYSRTVQYIHLVSNTAAPTPIDLWTPSTNNIRPQLSNQYAVGYFRNFGSDNEFETSAEIYYRGSQNQIEYVNGADIFINKLLEGDLISGVGRSYGIEFSVKKNTGLITGWLSYTLGKSELKTEGINNGEWYHTRFDQTHNLKLFGEYTINERKSLSMNFTLLTGTPITAPTSKFLNQGIIIPHNYYDRRNNYRIPTSHRLDVAYRIQLRKKDKPRRVDDYLVFSIYNLYANKNPFSIFFSQKFEENVTTPAPTIAQQFSIIGVPIPSISYNFTF